MKAARRLSMAAGLLAVVLFSLAVGVTEVQAGGKLILTVDVDEGSFVVAAGPPGPFNVEGDVDGGGAGTFQCWGWIFTNGDTNVSQVYIIAGRGSIMTQGLEGLPLAVVGGTGDFRNVRGEALQEFTGDGFNFNLVLNLTGAGV